jgi:hypothetical protein
LFSVFWPFCSCICLCLPSCCVRSAATMIPARWRTCTEYSRRGVISTTGGRHRQIDAAQVMVCGAAAYPADTAGPRLRAVPYGALQDTGLYHRHHTLPQHPLPLHRTQPGPPSDATHSHTRSLDGLSAQTAKREPTTPRALPMGSLKPPLHTGGPDCGRMMSRPRGRGWAILLLTSVLVGAILSKPNKESIRGPDQIRGDDRI